MELPWWPSEATWFRSRGPSAGRPRSPLTSASSGRRRSVRLDVDDASQAQAGGEVALSPADPRDYDVNSTAAQAGTASAVGTAHDASVSVIANAGVAQGAVVPGPTLESHGSHTPPATEIQLDPAAFRFAGQTPQTTDAQTAELRLTAKPGAVSVGDPPGEVGDVTTQTLDTSGPAEIELEPRSSLIVTENNDVLTTEDGTPLSADSNDFNPVVVASGGRTIQATSTISGADPAEAYDTDSLTSRPPFER